MEFERPHRSGTSSSELFICFTSRPSFSSSSSMKLSSKPILSPGRSDKCREPTLSFSSSLNRRLGSMKGGQSSPMFKKRGCGMENAEPTSPKVTCIGQVRVKTKKQGKKMMNLRKRENPQGGILQEKKEEECLPHKNQKWVHLPLTICETLRGFGSEFNCFLPCGGKSCSSRGRGGKRRTMSSCGAVFAKWLMALQEGEEEKRREMRVVVGEEDGKGDKGDGFDEIEEEKRKIKEEIEEYEEGRYSICIPPKNALLLMRCRSEPLRMSALANRFWDSSMQDEEEEEEEEEEDGDSEDEENDVKEVEEIKLGMEEDESHQLSEERVTEEADDKSPLEGECDSAEIGEDGENPIEEECYLECLNAIDEGISLKEDQGRSFNEEIRLSGEWGLGELFREEEKCVTEDNPLVEQWGSAKVDEEECVASEYVEEEIDDEQECIEEEIRKCIEELVLRKGEEIKEKALEVDEEETVNNEESSVVDIAVKTEEEEEGMKKVEEEEDSSNKRGGTAATLPDCLLMMMFEPKLSMEVSKETWVCSTDFAKPRSRKQVVVQQIKDGDNKKSEGNDIKKCNDRAQQQNEKSSVLSMTSMIEQRLMNAAAYEPYVLTRCKSEPLRSSAKLMIPDACFWKNRQLEAPPGVGF